MILPLILSMALQSVDIGITDLGQKPKNGQFFHQENRKTSSVMMNYYYDFNPWIDKARTAWIGVDGTVIDGIKYVKYNISNRGSVIVHQKQFLPSRNGVAYWLGFTGSREHASSVYGTPVVNLIEVQDQETLEIFATVVSKKEGVSFSTRPFRIKRYGGDSINPWYWESSSR